MTRAPLISGALSGLLLVALSAAAAEGEAPGEGAREEPEPRFEVSVGAAVISEFPIEGPAVQVGGGVTFAWTFIPEAWSVEVVFHVLAEGRGRQTFPVDALLEREFTWTPNLHPYLGVGVTVVPELEEGKVTAAVGLATVAGLEIAIGARWGVVVEVNFNLVNRDGLAAPEVGAYAGPLWRF
jgi:hypothetical protein